MKRILLVIKSDGIGGVERRVSYLLDICERRGIACDLVALQDSGVAFGLLADRHVRVLESPMSLSPLRRAHQLIQLRSLLRRNAYDLVVAFGPSPNALVSLARHHRTARVISEVGNPFVARRRLWNATMMWTYRRADALVVLTRRLEDELRATGKAPGRIVVSPYALNPTIPFVAPFTPRSTVIVSLGRLVPSKRVGDLVTAFASLAGRFPEWKLVIVGDGSDREALERQVLARGVNGRVKFTGFIREPWKELARASILVLSSAHEGFANVLVEAAAAGCALISSDCRFGPRELLNDGERGLLYPVGDVAQLTECLARFMGDEPLRQSFAERAHESVKQYQAAASADAWIDLLANLAAGTRG